MLSLQKTIQQIHGLENSGSSNSTALLPFQRRFVLNYFFPLYVIIKEKKSDRRLCSGKEDLSIGYKQDAKLTHVNNSIAVVATALKAMYEDK